MRTPRRINATANTPPTIFKMAVAHRIVTNVSSRAVAIFSMGPLGISGLMSRSDREPWRRS